MKITKLKIKNYNGGYEILELLFYISLFAILSIVVINSMITMTKAFRETTLQAEFLQSGSIMEQMGREIRQAYDINSISASDLKLNTTGADTAVEFKLVGSDLQFLENNSTTPTGNLNTPNIIVTALSFSQITTTVGKAVKISLTIRSSNDALNRAFDFNDTIVLRGNY
jgi:type II secretory pathway pseudopilin PulG